MTMKTGVDNKNPEQTYEHQRALAKHWYNEAQKEKHARQIAEQNLVVTQGLLDEYTGLYNGEFRTKNEVKKLADDIVDSEYAACNEIDSVYNKHKKPWQFKFTMWLAVALISIVIIWQYASNEAFREGANKNMPILVVGAVAFAVIVMYLSKRGKK